MPRTLSKAKVIEVNKLTILRMELRPQQKVVAFDIEYGNETTDGNYKRLGVARIVKQDSDYDAFIGKFLGDPTDPASIYAQIADKVYSEAEVQI